MLHQIIQPLAANGNVRTACNLVGRRTAEEGVWRMGKADVRIRCTDHATLVTCRRCLRVQTLAYHDGK